MGIGNRLFRTSETREGRAAGRATEEDRRRTRAKFGVVLGVLTAGVVATSVISPPAGHAAFPGANGKICFVSNRDGNYEIYVMNADGTGQTNLTNNPAVEFDCAWSADGTKIAFRSDRDGNIEIYVMNADGTGQARLTNTPESESVPAWSPDGTKITYSKDLAFGETEIFVMNADGSAQTQLTHNGVIDNAAVWSPDGTKIAFEHCVFGGDCEVFVMNADGTGQTNLTNNPALLDRDPSWSPDGTKIAFWRGGGGLAEIWVMNADGSGQTKLTTDDYQPVWSPDGTKIAFGFAAPGGLGEVSVMNTDGSGRTNLTNNPASDSTPDWQPVPPDTTPPTITCTVPDQTVWYGSDVSVPCTAIDSGSGLANPSDASFLLATSVVSGTEASSAATDSHQVCDQASNCATAGPYTFKVDEKGPSLSCLGTPVYTLNQAGATVSASVSDGGSGAAASPMSASAGTSSVGLESAPVTGYDNVGNPATVLCPYQVNYNFSGFFAPVNNPNTVNTRKARSAIPVKFSLSGDQGLGIMAAGSPFSQSIDCSLLGQDPTDPIETTVTAGGSSLTYDPTADQYIYVWKTLSTWAKSCRQLTVQLNDGTSHVALFRFS